MFAVDMSDLGFMFIYLMLLGLELRTYTLGHSASLLCVYVCWIFPR
jgi:hypothetical protein